MLESAEKPTRIEVWVAMADHFLDTETRHDIPFTALRCVDAGLSSAAAREVWLHEVSPAVGFNAFDIAGEWAGWDKEWLIGRIERLRTERDRRPRWCRRITDRLQIDLLRGTRTAVERCIDALSAEPAATDRRRWFRDVTFLARHYFDFCPAAWKALPALDRIRIRSLYPAPFQYIMAPALVSGEAADADRRVRTALELEDS